MDKFIPYEKLSKKQRRELNAQRREIWAISPVTRKPANPKAYNRQKTQKWINDDSHSVSSFFIKKVPAAEWVYAHVFLDQESKANLSFSYYPSGHMFYVEKASFDQFREQAGLWYQ